MLGITSAIGYGSAAVVTPAVTRRISPPAWVTVLLGGGAVATWLLGATSSWRSMPICMANERSPA